nr:aquaporin [Sphingobacterium sp. T2]
MEIKTSSKFIAELIGTFGLVLFGCGAAAIAGGTTLAGTSGLGLLGISLAFGLSVVVFAYAIGGVSGCHINPAVTVGMLCARRIAAKDAIVYIIAQFAGATLAAFVLSQILAGQMGGFTATEWAYGSNGWGKGYQNEYDMAAALIVEALLTAIFLFVHFGDNVKARKQHYGRTRYRFNFGIDTLGCHSGDGNLGKSRKKFWAGNLRRR